MSRIHAAGAAVALAAVAASATMSLGTNFWNLGWHSSSDCFSNVNNVTGSNPWNPTFLSEIDMYHSLRFMDWDETNGSTRSTWMERKQKSATQQNPVAYEWMVDLCNRVDADMWVTLPHRIVNRNTGDNPCDYALRLAILVKTGVDMRTVSLSGMSNLSTMTAQNFITAGGVQTGDPLEQQLRVYVEYSNETWNGVFAQSGYCQTEGNAMGLDADGTRAGYKFHGWAAIRLFHAFDLVFGDASPRVVRVFPGWTGQLLMSAMQFQMLEDPVRNPWGTTVDAIATAPYMGHSASDLAGLAAAIPTVTAQVKAARTAANQKGVWLFSYEGGQHLTTNAATVSRDAGIYSVYRAYLDSMNTSFDHFSHYNHVGQWGSGGAWGSMEHTGDGTSSHKYRALYDFQVANPVSIRPSPVLSMLPQAAAARNADAYTVLGRKVEQGDRLVRRLAPGVYLTRPDARCLETNTVLLP